jgi:hypothetical protein
MRDGQQPEAALRARLSLENGEVLTADARSSPLLHGAGEREALAE